MLLHRSSNLKLGRRQPEEAGDALFLFKWFQLQYLLTDIELVICARNNYEADLLVQLLNTLDQMPCRNVFSDHSYYDQEIEGQLLKDFQHAILVAVLLGVNFLCLLSKRYIWLAIEQRLQDTCHEVVSGQIDPDDAVLKAAPLLELKAKSADEEALTDTRLSYDLHNSIRIDHLVHYVKLLLSLQYFL